MGHDLVTEIMKACGKPVAGHTVSVQEMQQAVREGRELQVYYWSNFGEGEASFGFAEEFGLDGEGQVHPSYIVFPHPIPPELRRQSESDWEKPYEVFNAFGI